MSKAERWCQHLNLLSLPRLVQLLLVFLFSLSLVGGDVAKASASKKIKIFVMSDLFVGKDPKHWSPQDPEWATFEENLRHLKAMGVTGLTVDVWWGLVQTAENTFDFSYYDHLFEKVQSAGLKIVPILATHSCGGNVGDNCHIPLPSSVVEKLPTYSEGMDGRFLSEGGSWSNESLGVWSDPAPLYLPFYRAFRDHYASNYASSFAELIVSLGPAGELIYPSYHFHDSDLRSALGFEVAKYPNRGALQASSPLARLRFRQWLIQKYGNLEETNKTWGRNYRDWSEIDFFATTTKAEEFFARAGQFSLEGQDFFDWYFESLMQFGLKVIRIFSQTFHVESKKFQGVPIGHKVPGVHWDFENFRAFLTAGQGRTRGASLDESRPVKDRFPPHWSKERGYGLQSLVDDFLIPLRVQNQPSEFISTYTCGEQPNCEVVRPAGRVLTGGAYDLAEAFRLVTGRARYLRYEDLNGYNNFEARSGRVPEIAYETSLARALWNVHEMDNLMVHVYRAHHARSVVMLRMSQLAGERPAPAVATIHKLSNCELILAP